MLSGGELARKVGRKVLFIGTECYKWAVNDFGKAAANAKALGFDTICPKRADGQNKWYGTAGHLALERQACLAAGVGYIPFMYMYGPAFNNAQIEAESAIAKEMAGACDDLVCIDLEVEWNGQNLAANYLAAQFKGFKGDIIISTWADPVQQNWIGVLRALYPIASAVGPQMYTDWLALQEGQITGASGIPADRVFPALDIADMFGGANNPLATMHKMSQHGSIWFWEYQAGLTNPNLVRTMTALVGPLPTPTPGPVKAPTPPPVIKAPIPVTPVKLPAPKQLNKQLWLNYVIGDGDSLSGIAVKVGVTNWFADLYLPNKVQLDSIARQHGAVDSQGGALIFPGTTIKYLHLQ